MALIEWNEEFRTGIDQVDSDHRHLLDLLNNVYESFTNRLYPSKLGQVFDELVNYACYHFATEGEWMKSVGYPRHIEHTQQHDEFARRVVEMQKSFAAGKTGGLSLEVLTFMRNWLVNHILESDGQFRAFVKGKKAARSKPAVASCNRGVAAHDRLDRPARRV